MMRARLRLTCMARARHRAACAVAAAGGLSLSAVAHKMDNHKRHYRRKDKCNQNCCYVVRKECEHREASFAEIASFTFGYLVAVAAAACICARLFFSGSGRNSIKQMNPNTRNAAIEPMTLPCPVKSMPSW